MVVPALRHLLKEQTAETAKLHRKLKILEEAVKNIIQAHVAPDRLAHAHRDLNETLRLL